MVNSRMAVGCITSARKNTTEKTEGKRGTTTDNTDEHGSKTKSQPSSAGSCSALLLVFL
jgi:hypothetical protein